MERMPARIKRKKDRGGMRKGERKQEEDDDDDDDDDDEEEKTSKASEIDDGVGRIVHALHTEKGKGVV